MVIYLHILYGGKAQLNGQNIAAFGIENYKPTCRGDYRPDCHGDNDVDYTGNIRQVVAGHGEYGADANLHGNSADAESGD